MKIAVTILFLLSFFLSFSQISWNTASRIGLNKIGIGFDQTLGLKIGANFQHQFALGAKWYGMDVVFEKETIGPVLDYRFQFNSGESRMNFSFGLSSAIFFEKKDELSFRLIEMNLNNRGTLNKWRQLQPFYEIGMGIVNNRGDNGLGSISSSNYPNYYLNLGVIFILNGKPHE